MFKLNTTTAKYTTMEEALSEVPSYYKTTPHDISRAREKRLDAGAVCRSYQIQINDLKPRLDILTKKLKAAMQAEKVADAYYNLMCSDMYKCRGLPISVVGSKAVSLDKCIDSAQADAVLEKVSEYKIKCSACKAVSVCPRDPKSCPECGATVLLRKAILYTATGVLHYKC